jgi:hypothetical protein
MADQSDRLRIDTSVVNADSLSYRPGPACPGHLFQYPWRQVARIRRAMTNCMGQCFGRWVWHLRNSAKPSLG